MRMIFQLYVWQSIFHLQNNKPESFKIAFGGMSGIPQRSKKLEDFLLKHWQE